MANTVIRWNPFRELAAMQSAMDRLFDETWRDMRPDTLAGSLAIDVHETDDAYTVIADVPGVPADQIHVNLHDDVLSIGYEIAAPELAEGERALLQERFSGKATRRFSLPQKVDADKVEAAYQDGVLTLTLPKAAEAKPRQISVKRGGLLKSSN